MPSHYSDPRANPNPTGMSTAERASVAGRLAPTVTEESPMTISQMASRMGKDEDYVRGLVEVESRRWLNNWTKKWEAADDQRKQDLWGRVPEAEKELLSEMGYAPPDTSFWRRVKDTAGWLTGFAQVKVAASQVLRGLEWVQDTTSQYRHSNLLMREQSGMVNPGQQTTDVNFEMAAGSPTTWITWAKSLVPATLRPSTWREYWRKAGGREDYGFYAQHTDQVRNMGYGGAHLEVVKEVARQVVGGEGSYVAFKRIEDDNELRSAIARTLAGELGPEDPAQRAALLEDLMGDEQLPDALRTLVKGKVTTGNLVADSVGWQPGTKSYDFVSGMNDAGISLIDPILVGGSAAKTVRGARWAWMAHAIDKAEGTNRVFKVIDEFVQRPAARKVIDEMTDALNGALEYRAKRLNAGGKLTKREILDGHFGGLEGLVRRDPYRYAGVAKHLHKQLLDDEVLRGTRLVNEEGTWKVAKAFEADDVVDFYKTTTGQGLIASGQMGGWLYRMPVFPHLSRTQEFTRALRVGGRKVIDFAADTPFRHLAKLAQEAGTESAAQVAVQAGTTPRLLSRSGGVAQVAEEFGKAEAAKFAALVALPTTQMGRLAKWATTIHHSGPVDLLDPASVTQIQRFSDFLPRKMADAMVASYLDAKTVGQRMMVVRGITEEVLDASGVYRWKGGQKLADRFLKAFDESEMRFMTSGDDTVRINDMMQMPVAAYSGQVSAQLALPDFRKLWGLSKRATFWHRASGQDLLNSNAVDWFMQRVWAPGVLFRLGFALRAGGDEAAMLAMREGLGNTLRARMAASAVRRTDPQFESIMSRWVDYAKSYADDTWLEQVGEFLNPRRLAANAWGKRAVAALEAAKAGKGRLNQLVANLEMKVAGPELMKAARKLYGNSDMFFHSRLNHDLVSASRHGSSFYTHPRLQPGAEFIDEEQPWLQRRFTRKWEVKKLDEEDARRALAEGQHAFNSSPEAATIGRMLTDPDSDVAHKFRIWQEGLSGEDLARIDEIREQTARLSNQIDNAVAAGDEVLEARLRQQAAELRREAARYAPVDERAFKQAFALAWAEEVAANPKLQETFGWLGRSVRAGDDYVLEPGMYDYYTGQPLTEEALRYNVDLSDELRGEGVLGMVHGGTRHVDLDSDAIGEEWASLTNTAFGPDDTWSGTGHSARSVTRWLDDNGGQDAFERLILAHERAHIQLPRVTDEAVIEQAALEAVGYPPAVNHARNHVTAFESARRWGETLYEKMKEVGFARPRRVLDDAAQTELDELKESRRVFAYRARQGEDVDDELARLDQRIDEIEQTAEVELKPIPGYVKALSEGHGMTERQLQELGIDRLPESVLSQQTEILKRHIVADIVDFGFAEGLLPVIDYISREPALLLQYAKAMDQLEPLWDNYPVHKALLDNLVDAGFESASEAQRFLDDVWSSYNNLGRAEKLAMTPWQYLGKQGAPGKALVAFSKQARKDLKVQTSTVNGFKQTIRHDAPVLTLAKDDFDLTRRALDQVVDKEQWFDSVVLEQATNEVVPWIDSEPMASFLAGAGRNAFVFWWAEERFLKRLAGTLIHSPESLKKMQLTYHGLQQGGWIQKDQHGKDVFVYPGTSLATSAVSGLLSLFTGRDMRAPKLHKTTGKVEWILPGLDRMGMPYIGPLVGLPLRHLRERFPAAEGLINEVIGPIAADPNRPDWSLLVPTTVQNAMKVPDAVAHLGSASLQALAVMEAAGLGPADDADESEVEEFFDRHHNYTQVIQGLRTLYSLVAPTPASVEFEGAELNSELRELISALGPAEGLTEFLAAHPDATPWTVFTTESVSGGPVPATREAWEFMAQFEDFGQDYPRAFSYFIPFDPNYGENEFYDQAWTKMLAMELRRRKKPKEFWEDLKFAEAAPKYFEVQERYEELRSQVKGTPKAAEVDNAWLKWSAEYKRRHRTFTRVLNSTERAETRTDILNDIRRALADPRAPETAQSDALRRLTKVHDSYLGRLEEIKGYHRKPFQEYREQLKSAYLSWLSDEVDRNPFLAPLMQKVILPELRMDREEFDELRLQEAAQ